MAAGAGEASGVGFELEELLWPCGVKKTNLTLSSERVRNSRCRSTRKWGFRTPFPPLTGHRLLEGMADSGFWARKEQCESGDHLTVPGRTKVLKNGQERVKRTGAG